jgi:hypothetical protein
MIVPRDFTSDWFSQYENDLDILRGTLLIVDFSHLFWMHHGFGRAVNE